MHRCWLHQSNEGDCFQGNKGTVLIENSVVESCSKMGISTMETDLTLSKVQVSKNASTAIQHLLASLTLRDVTMKENLAGLVTNQSDLDLDRVVVAKSKSDGLTLVNASLGEVRNVLAYENQGAGIKLVSNIPMVRLYNLTLARNWGKELVCDKTATVYNSILWTDAGLSPYAGPCVFEYCDVRGGAPGTSNIDADPKFFGKPLPMLDFSFELQSASPCIDQGLDIVPGVSLMPEKDLNGLPRSADKIAGGRIIDLGAYELQ